MRTVFVSTIQPPPPFLPTGILAPVQCGLPSPIAFVASHQAGVPYAMMTGRAPPAFPTAMASGHVLQAKEVDLYLAWGGNVRCRVPIISAVNSALGWIVLLDAPGAIGVKMPMLIGSALTPEPAPWNAWPATEKRGKEAGDQQPNHAWTSEFNIRDIEDAVARVKGVMKGLVDAEQAPIAQPTVVVSSPQIPSLETITPTESATTTNEYELPFDLMLAEAMPPSGMRDVNVDQAPTPQEPKAPQLALF